MSERMVYVCAQVRRFCVCVCLCVHVKGKHRNVNNNFSQKRAMIKLGIEPKFSQGNRTVKTEGKCLRPRIS